MMRVYALFDLRSEMYVGGLLLFAANAAAIRALEDQVRSNTDSNLSRHPQDFDLMFLGTWDASDGSLQAQEYYNPTRVINAGALARYADTDVGQMEIAMNGGPDDLVMARAGVAEAVERIP